MGENSRERSKCKSPPSLADRRTTFEKLEDRLLLTTVTFNAPSSNSGDGTWVAGQRDGVNVHVGPAYLYYNTSPAAFPGFQVGDSMYLKVNYFDEGSGKLKVEYDSLTDNFDDTEFHTRSSRIDTQQFVSSYHLLENVQFANGGNGHDFRVNTSGAPISTVELSDQPFPDSGLEWVWSPPWEAPYAGPSREVDASTLTGKVLAGYQGWFNTPNDAADEGYVHWGHPGDWSIEQWPDANDYDQSELFPVPGVATASGEQAYLFSSANSSVVNRHFQWMREHDIDGVLVQRFRGSFMYKQPDGSYIGEPQWPVVNARDAAHREGRTWAIEYDIQNGGTTSQRDVVIQQVKDDWEYLTDPDGFDMLNDSHYQRENGMPVVTIFGLYVSSGNSYSTAQQTDLINYFHSRGVYVVGAGRHTESGSQIANAGLHDAYIPWQGYWKGGNSYSSDETRLNGVTQHVPHVFPGFSWTHLQNSSTATSRDREDGNFYWRMISDAANETDAPWYFIGMFDEYDEGTNLIPASDDPPAPDMDSGGNPLTYQVSDPMPNDWWMALTGAAKQALQKKVSINDTIPTESELENRSNVGGEAVWQGSGSDRLAAIDNPDGQIQTTTFSVDGKSFDAIYSLDNRLYFQVDDSFLLQDTNGRDVTIEVEYLDSGPGQFNAKYDSTTDSQKATEPAVLTGSGQWRTHRFQLSDAYFGNNQNGGADFLLEKIGGNLFVRRVRVIKESMLSVDVDLGSSNTVNGLQQFEFAGDGQTLATDVGGRSVRQLTGTPLSLYMYLRVDDNFANQVHAGLNAIVEVVYQDVGSGNLNIQYDSTIAAYKVASPISLEDSGEWRTARFYLDDAFFGNRQNGGADIRITGNHIPIDQVRLLHAFGDLAAPELEMASATINSPQNTVRVAWSMTDDWRSGLMDQWTVQEDNHIQIEWTNDGGLSWNSVGLVYEYASPASQSGYDTGAGASTWSDETTWDTSGLVSGTYQIRITPIDGRGNAGAYLETTEFGLVGVPALTGDYDQDAVVDGDDLTKWSDSYGTTTPPGSGADGNGNGFVDGADFLVWQRNFGAMLPPPITVEQPDSLSASAVPEPIRATDASDVAEQIVARDAGMVLWTKNNQPNVEPHYLSPETESPTVATINDQTLRLLARNAVPNDAEKVEFKLRTYDEAFSSYEESNGFLDSLEELPGEFLDL
ncbi:hypothetical protein [Bythopirellula goksoeyrii]|uniref:Uncharacterized protein n=1 Tax=Bythopirellula goksoeyrii TaxID=1400387 RepID=A0A5B9QQW3_9BACT|nr:hypothetical protein [Bythopirellula goksoeyrii]QEG36363.1 hypothetical protein Pr1d_36770 [Bythopirellula goksoeyrii]